MKEFFTKSFYGNTLGDWLFALLIVAGGVFAGRVLYWFLGTYVKRWAKRTKTRIDDVLVDMVEEPVSLTLVIIGFWYASKTLSFSEDFMIFLGHVFYLLITFNIAWFVVRIIDTLVQEILLPFVQNTENNLDDQILPLISKFIKIAIWIIAVIVGLDNAGYDVGALLAGLGIGGLALAMAAKDTVSNFFGGLTVFIDKPFAIRDRILISNIEGHVEEIGIRSTRIRKLDGRIVTLPNSTFINSAVENISSEPSRRIIINLNLTYDTTPEKMQQAIQILKKIAQETPGLDTYHRITFNNFADSSLKIEFMYFIGKSVNIYSTQSEINMQILKQFSEARLNFAFPTYTIHSN